MTGDTTIRYYRNPNVRDDPWVPTRRLSDGTAVQGPWKTEPLLREAYASIQVDGDTWWFVHSGDKLAPHLLPEIAHWIRLAQATLDSIHHSL